MRATPGAVAAGAWAALRVPLWLRGDRLSALLAPPAAVPSPARGVPRGAVGAAFLALRVLARVPGRAWRFTCLYRSAAECLLLRRYGVPAHVRIGVRSEDGAILAHAWVVRPGEGGAPPAPTNDDLIHALLGRAT
jgi:hypothetical protein